MGGAQTGEWWFPPDQRVPPPPAEGSAITILLFQVPGVNVELQARQRRIQEDKGLLLNLGVCLAHGCVGRTGLSPGLWHRGHGEWGRGAKSGGNTQNGSFPHQAVSDIPFSSAHQTMKCEAGWSMVQ